MRISLAIYTAIDGYAWQPGTELSIDFLNEAKRAIGPFPDASMGELPFGEAVLSGDWLVVVRYHVARSMDSFGRSALYVVLGAIPREEAGRVNVKALLQSPAFAAPMKPLPPMFVDYDGPAAMRSPLDFAASFTAEVPFEEALPWLGDAVAPRVGRLALSCVRTVGMPPKIRFAYDVPVKVPPRVVNGPYAEKLRRFMSQMERMARAIGYGRLILLALLGWCVAFLALVLLCLGGGRHEDGRTSHPGDAWLCPFCGVIRASDFSVYAQGGEGDGIAWPQAASAGKEPEIQTNGEFTVRQ